MSRRKIFGFFFVEVRENIAAPLNQLFPFYKPLCDLCERKSLNVFFDTMPNDSRDWLDDNLPSALFWTVKQCPNGPFL